MISKINVFAVAVFVQVVSAQLIGNGFGPQPNHLAEGGLAGAYGPGSAHLHPGAPPNLGYEAAACGFGLSLASLAANGGGFAVTSASPIAPSGITVQSENLMFEGPLAVTGQMPFLGAVALEGPLPAAGQGAVAYGCGNGEIGIVREDLGAGSGVPGPVGPNPAGPCGPHGPYGPIY